MWTEESINYEADTRHADIVTQDERTTNKDHETKLDEPRTSSYRAIVARLNYLTSDRPHIACPVQGLARSMDSPSEGCQEKPKRRGRYLITKPRAVIEFKW